MFDSISGTPSWRPMTDEDLFQRAHDLPTSYGRLAVEQFKESAVTSYGLGTALRKAQIPARAPDPIDYPLQPDPPGMLSGEPIPPPPAELPFDTAIRRLQQRTQERRQDMGAITKEEYEASPSFRKGVPFDEGMTKDRAAALAAWHDESEYRKSLIARGPNTVFGYAVQGLGMFAGSAADPINYVPMVSQAMRAASVARFGVIGGSTIAASADAATNTALFGLLTRQERGSFGDDVTYQAMLTDVAMAALVGAAFGGAVGGYQRWRSNRSLHALERTVEARRAVDDAIGDLVMGRDPDLSPQTADLIGRVADDFRFGSQFPAARFGQQGPAFRARLPELTRPDDAALSHIEASLGFLRGVKEEPDGITAWHGSPYDFDRFTTDQIGAGEGAQAFGRGLYFADARAVAESYSKMAAGPGRIVIPDRVKAALKEEGYLGFDSFGAAIADIRRAGDKWTDYWPIESQKNREIIENFRKNTEKFKRSASLYEVRIAARPDQMLDWDAPFSKQPKAVQDALAGLGIKPDWTGGQIYESSKLVPGEFADKRAAAEALRKRGIVGIRYLDGNSRGVGDGTRNYVVFDDNLISIVSKNGERIKGKDAVEVLNMRGDASARMGGPETRPIVVSTPKAIAPDPKEANAAATVGKRPKTAEEEFGVTPAKVEPAKPGEGSALPADKMPPDSPAQRVAARLAEFRSRVESGSPPEAPRTAPIDESPETMEFTQLQERGRLKPSEIADYAKTVEFEQQSAAYADGLIAAAICRLS